MNRVFVVGNGMTKFNNPKHVLDLDYTTMVAEAGTAALTDAGITIEDAQAAYVGYVGGDSCSGQRAVGALGYTGIPVYNLSSNCSSGSSALSLAVQAIRGGFIDTAFVAGFEKMSGASVWYDDRSYPCMPHIEAATRTHEIEFMKWSAGIFGNAGREHMERYGSRPEHFAMVGEKNHRHSAVNPNAQFREISTLQEVLDSKMIHDPVTVLQCSAPSTGAAAAVVMSEAEVRRRGLQSQAVEILGQGVASDDADSFNGSAINAVGFGMSQRAARTAFEQSGKGIEEMDLIELHDCFSPNEILTYEALGLAPEGKGHLLIEDGATTYGGQVVVNPSGGLIGKGHPLGATGLAQCAELSWQLRGLADQRQVSDARLGLQHNIGLGGTAVVTIYGAPSLN